MPKELGQKLLRCVLEPGREPVPGLYIHRKGVVDRQKVLRVKGGCVREEREREENRVLALINI